MSNFTTTLGRWTIDKLPEIEIPTNTQFLYPEWGAEEHLEFTMSVHTWVLRDGKQTILIDTGAGNGKHRPETAFLNQLNSPYLERLAELGVAPESVDHVLFTHIHVDHVGWNTHFSDGAWRPTFPNARHLCTLPELDYYAHPEGTNPNGNNVLAYADSVLPLREAGLVDIVEADGREVLPGISFLSTPGHSVDHSVIRLADGAGVAYFLGDLMHNPIQVARPELSSRYCLNPEQARQSRERILPLAVEENGLILPAHFSGTSAGRVRRRGNAYAWEATGDFPEE